METGDKRLVQRLNVEGLLSVKLFMSDYSESEKLEVYDIARKGIKLKRPVKCRSKKGNQILMKFNLEDAVHFDINATVVRVEETYMAAEFFTDADTVKWVDRLCGLLSNLKFLAKGNSNS